MLKKDRFILVFIFIINSFYNIFLPLYSDEAYYWMWSKRLELSYFDHPPMVGYLIKLFTLLGDNIFFLRLGATVSMTVAAYIIYLLTKDIFNIRVASISLYIFLSSIIVQGGYMLITPDSPLIMFWSLTLYFAYKYIFKKDNFSAYLMGIFGGMLLLSKYTGILLLISLILFCLITKYRKVFFKKETYIAMLLVTLIFSPVLLWNYDHSWTSFKFQFFHGVSTEKIIKLRYLGDYLGAQIGLLHPIYFFLTFYFLIKNRKEIFENKKLLFLNICFIFTFLFFMYQSLFKRTEGNWAAPAYIALTPIIAYYIDKYKMKKTLTTAISITIIAILFVKMPVFIKTAPKSIKVLQSRLLGFDAVKDQLNVDLDQYPYILIDSYHSSDIAFALKRWKNVHLVTPARISHYDLWREKEFGGDIKTWEDIWTTNKKAPIKKAIFIGKLGEQKYDRTRFYGDKILDNLNSLFNTVTEKQILTYESDNEKIEYIVYEVENK